MKTLLLTTVLIASSGFTYAQTVGELRASISKKLERVNNNRAALVNLNRSDLILVENSLKDIVQTLRTDRRDTRVDRPNRQNRNTRNDRNRFGRLEALQTLETIENSTNDATSVFQMIEHDVERGTTTWEVGVNAYRTILNAVGGNGQTADAKLAYGKVQSLALSAGITTQEALDGLVMLVRSENSPAEAIGNLELAINLSVSTSMNPIKAVQAMDVLVRGIGNGNTADIRVIFRNLANKKVTGILVAVNDLLELNKLENTSTDAMGSYELVLRAAGSGHRYGRALSAMMDLTRQYGSGQTATIREKFRMIYR